MSKPREKDPPLINRKSLRKALRTWHNTPLLGKHPLVNLKLVAQRQQKGGYSDTLEDQGRALRDVLRDVINTFPQPEHWIEQKDQVHYLDKAWRPYVILTERFINSRNIDYVAAQLGIALRTFHEEQIKALNTLVDVLRQRETLLESETTSLPVKSARPGKDSLAAQLARMPVSQIPNYAPLPAHSIMPLMRNPLFVGREQDLLMLAHILKGGETVAIGQTETAAATGLGGIGKTQLANEFVHRYGQFFAGGIFWLSFADEKAVPSEVANCGRVGAMNLHPNFADLSLDDQVNLVKAAWQDPIPRLLVFDNCEDPDLLFQWRPVSGGCRVLVTSRRAEWEPMLGVQSLVLDVLKRDESLALLRKYKFDGEDKLLDAIAEELGDLPLALHLAGSYLYRYQRIISPQKYLEQLQDPALLDHPSMKGTGISPTRHVQNAYRTIALSYDRLDPTHSMDACALKILARAACLAPGESIPHHLLTLTLHLPEDDLDATLQAEDGLKRLVELGLVRTEERETIRLHRLVVAFVRDVVGDALVEAQAKVEMAVCDEAARINERKDPRPILDWQPHLRFVTQAALTREDLVTAKLCNQLGQHLWQIGDLVEGRPYFEQALTIRQRLLGEEHPDTAYSLDRLGFLLRAQGNLDEAGPCFERALAIREKVLGETHPDTAISLNEVGRWWHLQGDFLKAQQYHERALRVNRAVLGEDHHLTAEYLNNIGASLLDSGDLNGSLPYLKQALTINERLFGPEHPDVALNLNNIGYVLRLLGEPIQAQAYHERALNIRLKILGPDHSDTGMSLRNLGTALQDQGRFDEAQVHLERALVIHEEAEGEEHQQTAICVTYLGLLFHAKRELNQAKHYLKRALIIRQKLLRSDSPFLAVSLTYLGKVLQDQGDLKGAQLHLEQALAIRQQTLGKKHLLIGQCLSILGDILKAQGDIVKARSYYCQALTIFETQLDLQHSDIVNIQEKLETVMA